MTRPLPVSRRTCLGALAGVVATTATATPLPSPLDELIADWRMANEEADALNAEADRILAAADLPTVEVQVRSRCFHYPDQIRQSFDPLIAAWEGDRLQAEFAPSLRLQRDELIADLEKQKATRKEAERNCGLTVADALADQASDRAYAIRKEIIAWRPADMAEVAAKNAWLLQRVRDGILLPNELETIFASCARHA